MTPEAQRIAIAELDGWRASDRMQDYVDYVKTGETVSVCRVWTKYMTLGGCRFPDYLTDLNPIHATIRAQPREIQRTISQNLTTRLMTVKGDQWDDNLALILATPEMLCEQLLRAAGKWEGGK